MAHSKKLLNARDAVFKWYKEGKPIKEIADLIGMSYGTVHIILKEGEDAPQQQQQEKEDEHPFTTEVALYKCPVCKFRVIYDPCLICMARGQIELERK